MGTWGGTIRTRTPEVKARMKALKSDLAKRVLADPTARAQLRDANSGSWVVLREKSGRGPHSSMPTISVHDKNGRVVHVTPIVVPKAA